MQLEFHQIDAFTEHAFRGNPAMVYRLDAWLPDELMQRIAAEHNLAETAFVVREGAAWHIRWFTPAAEVPLCGHATLASAYVLFECYGETASRLDFTCTSGALGVTREGERLVLDFPAIQAERVAVSASLEQALGCKVLEAWQSKELMAVLASEQAVRDCAPDLKALAEQPGLGVIVTARGERHDFVSRYFAPFIGIDEDPVTGSTHCVMVPYWAERLGRQQLDAAQLSARGGELFCRLEGERVKIAGHAVKVAQGTIYL
ncbi:PhzF family phenazine biosynthesis protein [Pseudomonas sp. LRF_L74]|uniref:PhzF family phenazine biosynthesis protein n=1 Tax=Pseudomonas sp. LRF_L74 TaxID=3369422 RepID=UPI003F607208